jgi:outer membrane receptor protein involved in Fe transport
MIAPWQFQALNVDKVRRQGIETELKYALDDRLNLSAGFEVNRVQDRLTDALIRGNGVPRTASHIGLDYSFARPGDLVGRVGAVHEPPVLQIGILGNYCFWDEPPASYAHDRRFTWDARVSYDLSGVAKKPLSAFLNIINIFDQESYYNKLLPSPGRTIELGMRYSF